MLAADRLRPEVWAWCPAHACMRSRGELWHTFFMRGMGYGVDGPPLQNGLPLMHRQHCKGLHGRAHGQQHPWGRHSCCARPRPQEKEQPADQQHGVNALQACFMGGLTTGLHEPAHHQQQPWSGPCLGAVYSSPRPQHAYACLPGRPLMTLRCGSCVGGARSLPMKRCLLFL